MAKFSPLLQGRPIPQDTDAEQMVLAMMLKRDPDAIPYITGLVQPEYFYLPAHLDIYNRIVMHWEDGKPVTWEVVAKGLDPSTSLVDAVADAHQTSLASRLKAMSGLGFYNRNVAGAWCADLRKAHEKRQLIDAFARGIEAVYDGIDADPMDIRAEAVEALLVLDGDGAQGLSRISADIFGADGLEQEIVNFADDPSAARGITVGWSIMDEVLGGFEKGRTYTTIADTSSGKSWWTHWLAWSLANNQKRSLIFSTEMNRREVMWRINQMAARVDTFLARRDKFLSDAQKHAWLEAKDRVKKLPIYVCNAGGMEVEKMWQEIRRVQTAGGLDMVFVDHLQGLRAKGVSPGDQRATLDVVTATTKAIAMATDLPLHQISHANRGTFAAGGRVGLRSGLGSGSIERDSDAVMALNVVTYNDETGQWDLFADRTAYNDFKRIHNKIAVEATFEKSRTGGSPWDVLWLDWNQGGRFISVAHEEG